MAAGREPDILALGWGVAASHNGSGVVGSLCAPFERKKCNVPHVSFNDRASCQ